MDAFTGKEQNRANVVPMMCQFERLEVKDLSTNYITGIMTNPEIGVIVITVKNKADRMSPERKNHGNS